MEDFERCSVCRRTPLIGEGFTILGGSRREEMVCDLCLANPRAAAIGEHLRRGRVRSAAGAANVQRIVPQPVRAPAARKAASKSAPAV